MKNIKKWFLLFIVVMTLIVIFEVALRSVSFVATAQKIQQVDPTSSIIHRKPFHKFVFSQGVFGGLTVNHQTNNYGFNTVVDFANDKSVTCVIGDGYVDALHVRREESFSAIINEKGINIFPVGITGAQLSQYIIFLEWMKKEFDCRKYVFVITEDSFDKNILPTKIAPQGFHYFDTDGKLVLNPYYPSVTKRLLRESRAVNYLYYNLYLKTPLSYMYQAGRISLNWASQFGNQNQNDMKASDNHRNTTDMFFSALTHSKAYSQDILFVLDGDRRSIYNGHEGRQDLNKIFYDYFVQKVDENNLVYMDLHKNFQNAYAKNPMKFNFSYDYHWNELGHSIVADAIIESDFLE